MAMADDDTVRQADPIKFGSFTLAQAIGPKGWSRPRSAYSLRRFAGRQLP